MKRWNVRSAYKPDKEILDQLLELRGFKTAKAKEEFLNPPELKELIRTLPKDFTESLKKAKKLILDEISKKTHIVVFGDYDADGVCATAILLSAIKNELKYKNVSYFVPNRFEHGYGMSLDAVTEILEKNKGKKMLFITVDTGITAKEETEYIRSMGHKIIITDHHQKPPTIPKPDVLVWYDQVVGSVLSWFLSNILGSRNIHNLAYTAIATVTDLQPLNGINRSIVKKGIEVLNSNPPLGIKQLLKASGRDTSELSAYDLGWIIGPRLNASGRLVSAHDSINLLLETHEEKAYRLAQKLNSVNIERQDKTLEMYDIALLDEETEIPRIIISHDENYHEGVIGLVASKLVQKYHRPSIVISLSDGVGKGSVRSVPGINIIEILRKFDDLFVNLGGHPMAAGFTIKQENIDLFKLKLNEYAHNYFDESLLIPEVEIDLEIPMDEVDLNLVIDIEKMKPFGAGNPEPLFLTKKAGIFEIRNIGRENAHILIKFYYNGGYFKGVWFNGADYMSNLNIADSVDAVYSIRRNEFNGKVSVDLIIKDIRLS